jgi:hypothetical protein
MTLFSLASAQFAEQAVSFGGTDGELITASAYDAFGNLFIGGSFRDSCDFAPGPATFPVQGGALDNIYVARYGTDLQPDWVARMGGGVWLDQVRAMAVGPLGQVVVAGTFHESGDFDPGPGVITLTSLHESDIFLAQLDPQGALSWLIHLPDSSFDQVWDVGVDNENNVYIVGGGLDSVDVDPGPGVVIVNGTTAVMDYVLKYDQDGNFLWHNPVDANLIKLLIDETGNLLVTGELQWECDIDPGPNEVLVDPSNGEQIVIEYLPSGALNSYFQYGDLWNDSWGIVVSDMQLDPNGNLFIGGWVQGTVDVDPGPGQTIVGEGDGPVPDWFCLKFLANGQLGWAVSSGSATSESVYDLTLAPDGSVICALRYSSPFDADPGPGVWMVDTHGIPTSETPDDDALILVLDPNGGFVRATQIWGEDGAFVSETRYSPSGALMAVGAFSDAIIFDAPDGTMLEGVGALDCFIAELDLNYWTGITEQAGSTFQLFPVPTDGRVTARSRSPFTAITVHDAVGTLVYSDSFSPRTAYDLQLEHVGTYLCRFMDGGAQVGMGRVVVVR